jgi:hypothetical protein
MPEGASADTVPYRMLPDGTLEPVATIA